MKLLDDLLKTGGKKFSQARVYLFASVVVYFVTILIYLSHAFFGIVSDVNVLMNIMGSLQYMMLIFAAYALVGKGIDGATIASRLEAHAKYAPTQNHPVNDGRIITPRGKNPNMVPGAHQEDKDDEPSYRGRHGRDEDGQYERRSRGTLHEDSDGQELS